ncbi:MAG: tetrahydromethanopterin S-methyltransferase subunit H [Pirellulales bacterium]|nr:tetrahydromethanopterin S-methyltransferase subunit H [Pirellulales bacterium]
MFKSHECFYKTQIIEKEALMARDTASGLFEYQVEQKRFEIAGIQIGGLPGVQPTVMIGSIFYHGHKICMDEDRGTFDRAAAEAAIRGQEDYSTRTGCPGMLDVVGATPEAIVQHLEFVAGITDLPLLIDGTTTDVRLAGLEHATRIGIVDRIVYNSIQPEISDEELAALKKAGVKSAILLTYYLRDFSAAGRLMAVRELVPKAEAAGIEHLLVDTCILDLATLGQACGAIHDVKNEFGLPAGGGVHNAVAVWRGLKTKMGPEAEKPCIASVNAAAVAVGADFLLYGPVEDAKYVFPAVAMVNTALSQLALERGFKPADGHPRFRIG